MLCTAECAQNPDQAGELSRGSVGPNYFVQLLRCEQLLVHGCVALLHAVGAWEQWSLQGELLC